MFERTCTEIRPDPGLGIVSGDSKPLSAFWHLPAVVLLGDLGTGETTAFQQECEALGSAAEYVKARNVSTPKKWRHTLLSGEAGAVHLVGLALKWKAEGHRLVGVRL